MATGEPFNPYGRLTQIMVPLALAESGKVSPLALIVYARIQFHKSRTAMSCDLHRETLAKELKVSVDKLDRAVGELKKHGLLRVERQGRSHPNRYTFLDSELLYDSVAVRNQETDDSVKVPSHPVMTPQKHGVIRDISPQNWAHESVPLRSASLVENLKELSLRGELDFSEYGKPKSELFEVPPKPEPRPEPAPLAAPHEPLKPLYGPTILDQESGWGDFVEAWNFAHSSKIPNTQQWQGALHQWRLATPEERLEAIACIPLGVQLTAYVVTEGLPENYLRYKRWVEIRRRADNRIAEERQKKGAATATKRGGGAPDALELLAKEKEKYRLIGVEEDRARAEGREVDEAVITAILEGKEIQKRAS